MVLKELDPQKDDDVQLCAALLCAAPRYLLDTLGRMPTAADGHHLIHGVPAACRPEDIAVFAAFEDYEAIGLLQVRRRFVHAHRANIGLLLVRPEWCRRGYGSRMLRQLADLSVGWKGITHFSAAVLESNAAGLAFWRSAGFTTVSSGYVKPGCPTTLTVMERLARPAAQRVDGQAPRQMTGSATNGYQRA